MSPISLLGVASYLPDEIVTNEFFGPGVSERRGMFTPPTTRRHVSREQTAADMIERAAARLIAGLNLTPSRDIDVLFTNVTIPDQPFTGVGAEIAFRLGCQPRAVVDLHNTGCVSFVYMLQLARELMAGGGGKGALLCNVQNAAGRVFRHPEVRTTRQAPVPGDGCGVAYVAASAISPVLATVVELHGEYARDMTVAADDGRQYWEPGPTPIRVAFTETRVASIIARGNQLVPDRVRQVCGLAGKEVRDIDLLITNQPNPIFLRNWREALELPPSRHHDTYDVYGNLFGAGIPISLEDAIARGRLARGALLALGGFAHAGDYSGAALISWRGGE